MFFEIFLQSKLVCTYDELNIYAKELRVIGTSKAQSILFWHEGLNGVMDFTVNCQIVGHFTANSWLPSFVIKEPFLQLTFLRLSAKIFWLFYS